MMDRTLTLKLTSIDERDFDRLADIGRASAERVGDAVSFRHADLTAMLHWPRLGPEGLWGIRDEGVLIGLVRYLRYLDAGLPHVLGLITIDPEFRGDDVGDWAYQQILERARQDGAQAIDAIIDSRDKEAMGFIGRRGFDRLVTLWTLAADSNFAPAEAPRVPSGYRLREYRPGEDTSLLTDLYNRTFDRHMTFCPASTEETRAIETTPYFDPRLAALLETEEGTVVGYSRCTLRADVKDAWIDVLGVLPEYQGRGLGRYLLVWSMYTLAQARPKVIQLVVEGANDTARALYDSEGFMVLRTRTRYRKMLT
jgi:mycothiol synthase